MVGPVGALEVAMGFEHQISLGLSTGDARKVWEMVHENDQMMKYDMIQYVLDILCQP